MRARIARYLLQACLIVVIALIYERVIGISTVWDAMTLGGLGGGISAVICEFLLGDAPNTS